MEGFTLASARGFRGHRFRENTQLVLALSSALSIAPACGSGNTHDSQEPSESGGRSNIDRPLLSEPKGTSESIFVDIRAEGERVPALDVTYSGAYEPSQAESEYVRCSFGNDPSNLGRTRLAVTVGTIGTEAIAELTLRALEENEPKSGVLEYEASMSPQMLEFQLRTPSLEAPNLAYGFGQKAKAKSKCQFNVDEFSKTRIEGTLACAGLVELGAGDSTLSATLNFECPLGDTPSDSGSGGTSGNGGGSGLGGSIVGGGSSGGAGSGGGPATSLTISEFCDGEFKLEAAWCDYIDQCCSAADQDDVNFEPAACEFGAGSREACEDDLNFKAKEGGTWDGGSALECLIELSKLVDPPPTVCAGLRQASREYAYRSPYAKYRIPACRKMMTAGTQVGQHCDFLESCAPDLTCYSRDVDLNCRAYTEVGQPCDLDQECEPGLLCGLFSGVCIERGSDGAPCDDDSGCKDGLGCTGFGECMTPLAPLSPCRVTDLCAPGFECGIFGSGLACIPLAQVGDSCTSSFDCDGRCDKITSRCVEICGGSAF